MVKRHQAQSQTKQGGIISKEAPIHLSNLAVADPKTGKADAGRVQGAGRRPQGALSPRVRGV